MQDETVLFNPATKQFCVLNATAAFLWEQLAEPQTEAELSTRLCGAFEGVEGPVAARDVQATLHRLTDLKVVVSV